MFFYYVSNLANNFLLNENLITEDRKQNVRAWWTHNIYKDLQSWLELRSNKTVLTIRGLVTQLNYGWSLKKNFICFYKTGPVENFLDILREHGYIYEYYYMKPVEAVFFPLLKIQDNRVVVVVWLKPKERFSNSLTPTITWYPHNSYQYALTYEKLQMLIKVSNHTFIFNSSWGLVSHKFLLKKQSGGLLLCSILK